MDKSVNDERRARNIFKIIHGDISHTKVYRNAKDIKSGEYFRLYSKEYTHKRKTSEDFPLYIKKYNYGEENNEDYTTSSSGLLFICGEYSYLTRRYEDIKGVRCIPGGKREFAEESSIGIAIREFIEETCNKRANIEKAYQDITILLENNRCQKIWLRECKYDLYVVHLDSSYREQQSGNYSILHTEDNDHFIAKWHKIDYTKYEEYNLHPVLKSYAKLVHGTMNI